MPINDWLDFMPFTVIYEAVATRDVYGKPATYATAVSYRARIASKQQRVASRNASSGSEDVVSSTQVWVNGTITGLNVDDRVTLPDSTTPLIISWDSVTDENGSHHTKIYLR